MDVLVAGAGSGGTETGTEPVFVDSSGRRAKLIRRAGAGAALVLAAYLAVVGAGVVFGVEAPLTPWTSGGQGRTGGAEGGPRLKPLVGQDAGGRSGDAEPASVLPRPTPGVTPGEVTPRPSGGGDRTSPAPSRSASPASPGPPSRLLPPPAGDESDPPGNAPAIPPGLGGDRPRGKPTS